MNAIPLPLAEPSGRTPVSATFTATFNVLEGYELAFPDHAPYPRIAFAHDQWHFGDVSGVPANAHTVKVDFAEDLAVPEWRLLIKELAAALLNPRHPAVEVLPRARFKPLPLHGLYYRVWGYRLWLRWLGEHGVRDLHDVDQGHCDAYLAEARERLAPKSLGRYIDSVRDIGDYGAVLAQTYDVAFRPWGRRSVNAITGAPSRRTNTTRVLPDAVLSPLLAGAMFWVDVASADVLDARDEWRRLNTQPPRTARAEIDERLPALIDEYRCRGEGLPKLSPLHQHGSRRQDELAELSIGMLGYQAGLRDLRMSALADQHVALLRDAVRELGLEEGGLWTPMTPVTPYGASEDALRPWRNPINPIELRWLLSHMRAACYVVLLAVSGMRPSEPFELRTGCADPSDTGHGRIRWQLVGRLMKQRDHGGDEERWTVIEEAVRAIRVLERLVDDRPDARLLARFDITKGRNASSARAFDAPLALKQLIAWQHEHGRRAGLPPIPDVDGAPWPIEPRQFRRTLARQLAYRPHGVLAAKVQLKHVRAAVTEGYFTVHGESVESLLREIEAEQENARLDRVVAQFNDWDRDGVGTTGGASKRLHEEFAAVKQTLAAEGFAGAVDQRDKRLKELLRRRAGALHIGLVADCHFQDARQARCLRDSPSATAPIVAACEPTRCSQSIMGRAHVPVWRSSLLEIQELRRDRRTPPLERERLAAEEARHQRVLEGIS